MSHKITVEEIVGHTTAEVLFEKDDEYTLAVVEFDAERGEGPRSPGYDITITSATILLFGQDFNAFEQMSGEIEREICDALAVAYVEHLEQSADYS